MKVALNLFTAAALTVTGAVAYAGSSSHGTAEPTMAAADRGKASSSSGTLRSKSEHGAVSQKSADKGAHGGGHWDYQGDAGPERWGKLSADYALCSKGTTQSPVDIADTSGASVVPIEFDYRLTPLRILNNGHTVQVNYAPGSGITVNGERFELLQFHFHTPSEHAINGKRAVMEVHFVHKNARGQLAVVGVMMEEGDNNMALREIWQNLPTSKGPEKSYRNTLINGRDLLPQDHGYYRYMGSLTTPPCSEGVNWYVMQSPVQVDGDQASRFAKAAGRNARPLQAINNRLLLAPLNVN